MRSPEARTWSFAETVKHQFFDFLMLVGLRDRLRCPHCMAVGTWKPHGGWVDRLYDWWTDFRDLKAVFARGAVYATDRRWVCKFCGYTRHGAGEHMGAPNGKLGVWGVRCADSIPTPKEAVEQLCGKTWPWRG